MDSKSADGTVSCDGGGGALGHPLVYLEINPAHGSHEVVCPYCSRRFVLNKDAPAAQAS